MKSILFLTSIICLVLIGSIFGACKNPIINTQEICITINTESARVLIGEPGQLKIIKAIFTLRYPSGTDETQEWELNDPNTLIFPAKEFGVHLLSIIEIDESENISEATVSFEVSPGYNTIISITLGGNTILHKTNAIPLESLVGEYLFNGNGNDSALQNDAIVYGAQLSTNRFGIENSAYLFNGQTDYIHSETTITNCDSFSISFWLIIDTDTASDIMQLIQTPNGMIIYNISTQSFWFTSFHDRYGGASTDIASQTIYSIPENLIEDNIWQHIVMTVDQSNSIKVYINNLEINNGELILDYGVTGDYTSLAIGASVNDDLNHPLHIKYPLNGKIDDVRLYSRILSEEEIELLYNE